MTRRPARPTLRADHAVRATAIAFGSAVSLGTAHAQDAPAPRTVDIATVLTAEQSIVDVRARPSGDNGTEFVTRVSPGIRLVSRSGRVQGSLSYNASLLYRTGLPDSEGAEWLNALDASFAAEAVPNWAYVDVRGSVSQQSLSAFGRSARSTLSANDNRTEVATLSVSPYVRGVLGGIAEYEVRLTGQATRGRDATAPDSNSASAVASLASSRRGAVLGWGLVASKQTSEFSGTAGETETDRINATVTVTPDIDWRFTLSGGRESTNVASAVRREYDNYGLGVQWTPSPRTSVLLQGEERYFGRSHRAQLRWRAARTTFSYTDSRDVSNGADAAGIGTPVTLYQLFFQLFAGVEPDPIARDVLVRDFIRSIGRDPAETVAGGALAAGVSVQRRQELAAAVQGLRTTLALQVYRGETQRIDLGAAATPAGNENVVQFGYTGSVSHRLTPTVTVTAGGSYLRALATATQPSTNEKSASLGLTSQLGRRATGALTARYTVFNSPTDPSRETSVTGSISLRF